MESTFKMYLGERMKRIWSEWFTVEDFCAAGQRKKTADDCVVQTLSAESPTEKKRHEIILLEKIMNQSLQDLHI